MNTYERDYYVGTISVLSNNLNHIINYAEDIMRRLDELEQSLIDAANQHDDEEFDSVYEEGIKYGVWEATKNIPNASKLCMCDDCWDIGVKIGLDTVDDPSYRMD